MINIARLSASQTSLLSLYEENYRLFRLLLPILPETDGWFVLEAKDSAPVYGHRLSIHSYTSEWLLGHHFPHKKRLFAPDFTIRIYHDARLAEAMLTETVAIKEMKLKKAQLNRALAEWLTYCRRRQLVLNPKANIAHLPTIEALV
ncbi:DUF1249 domain-containing protein [Suttonella ornithocola]|uniref:Putative dehydrogenase n=1 Tax=Suttonella ornithocola TaxID=279832 RepID=A0A380N000_9GAMM|nr:DUF1249 domain-containing protein [Suttonella ornithocola]SUO97848.1 putative dehydrogenase [Suttonella ornithocola]